MNNDIKLRLNTGDNLVELSQIMVRSFEKSVEEGLGRIDRSIIPMEDDLHEIENVPGMYLYEIIQGDKLIGGTLLVIDEETQHNRLELLFLSDAVRGKGIGAEAWRTIEKEYPNTIVWETDTPDFSKRNINFYVNKCGFSIVEYYNKYHQPPDPEQQGMYDEFGLFRFEKKMKSTVL